MSYKSLLQQLCHKQLWELPEYVTVRDGPPHLPRFSATVTLNDKSFESPPVGFRTLKQAQNEAAKVAYDYYSTTLQGSSSPTATKVESSETPISAGKGSSSPTATKVESSETLTSAGKELLHSYKTLLQLHAQKRNIVLPTYSYDIVGPPHNRRFKSKVIYEGNSFESPKYHNTLKDAEHAAAKVALEFLSPQETPEDHNLYKSVIQEFAQKKGFPLPSYKTVQSGESHIPDFVSIVEIMGQSFEGHIAKTKKMAEANAAKTAYICLTDKITQ